MNKLNQIEVNQPRKIASWVILVQLVVTLVMAGLFYLIWNWQAAYSGFIAGVICAIVNAFFAWRVFRHKGARAAKRFVLAFCFGEMMKLIMLGVLFVLAVLYLKLAMLPFLVSFIINLMIYWLAPFMIFGFIK